MTDQRLNNLVLPVGRYVTGDHTRRQPTDMDGRPIPPDDQTFDIGVAVRKDAPGLQELIQQLWGFAANAFARDGSVLQRMQRGFAVGTKQGGISWKVKDGDTPNAKGEMSEHSRGCFVFYFSSKFPGKCCDARNVEIDPATIKRGYYVDVAFSIAANGQTGDRAGIFLNQGIMRMQGFGPEIVGGMTPDQAFGNTPVTYAPPGMSQAPVAGAMPGMPGAPQQQMPQAPAYPPQYQAPAYPPQQPQYPGAPQQQMPQAPAYPPQQPVFPMPGATMPGAPMTVPMTAPGGYVPQPATPATGYPSSQPGFPGAPQPGGNMPLPTGYPINPATGQPIQPHPQFLQPPR